jgi:UDP-N-acetylmuramyl tripeptide synthase
VSTPLNRLLDGIAALPANDARIEDLTLDSREARAGSLFLALQGRTMHGLKFAPRLPATVFAAPVPGLSALA